MELKYFKFNAQKFEAFRGYSKTVTKLKLEHIYLPPFSTDYVEGPSCSIPLSVFWQTEGHLKRATKLVQYFLRKRKRPVSAKDLTAAVNYLTLATLFDDDKVYRVFNNFSYFAIEILSSRLLNYTELIALVYPRESLPYGLDKPAETVLTKYFKFKESLSRAIVKSSDRDIRFELRLLLFIPQHTVTKNLVKLKYENFSPEQ